VTALTKKSRKENQSGTFRTKKKKKGRRKLWEKKVLKEVGRGSEKKYLVGVWGGEGGK